MREIVLFMGLLFSLLLSGCDNEAETKQVSLASGNLILDNSHGEGGAAWGLPDCSACHAMEVIHTNADTVRGIVRDKGFTTCTGCHGRNGTNVSEQRHCAICHNNNDLPTAPIQQGQHGHVFEATKTGSISDEQCLACHVASDMDGLFEVDTDLTVYPNAMQNNIAYDSVSDFCLRCHNRDHQQSGYEISGSSYDDPLIAVEDAFNYVDQHGLIDGTGTRTFAGLRQGYQYQTTVACTDCHAMHGTNNSKLIIDSSDKGATQLNSALREKPYAVLVDNGDYSQLCVLCHQMAVVLDEGDLDTGNGLAGVHEVGSDCRSCHTHGEAVQAGL